LKNFFLTYIFYSLYFTITLNAQKLATEHTLLQGRLENGFKYTVKENSKPTNRAELRLVIKVGSVDEDDDQKGVAHFIEHLAFNGTKHFSHNSLIKYLESIGIKFGQHLNAHTGYEETVYKLTIPLEKDNLEKSFLIFRDWADALNFNPKEFEKERGVILEEARSSNTLGLRLYNKSKHTILNNSEFLNRLPIGDKKTIKNISLKRVKDFYTKWYRPELMHFIAVGDFNPSRVEKLIKKNFSSLKNTNNTQQISRNIPDVNHTQVLSLTDPELTSNSLSVQYIDETIYPRNHKDIKDGVIEGIIYNLFNLKAEEQVLKKNPYATTIVLKNQKISNKKGSYAFAVTYREGNALNALNELYKIIFSFQKNGFSEENFNLVKKHRLALNEKKHKRLSDMKSKKIISSLVNSTINNSIFVDYEEKYQLKKKYLEEISLSEVETKFKQIIKIQNRVITFFTTNNCKISKKETLASIENAKKNLIDYKKIKKIPKKLLDENLTHQKISHKNYFKKVNIHEFILENGIKINFKKTNFTKNKLILYATSFGGTSLYSLNQLQHAKKASHFVQKSGIGKFSSVDIIKLLASKDISVNLNISKLTESIYSTANVADVESMFELIYLKIQQSKIDKIPANNYKQYLKDRVQKEDKNPKIKFQKERSLFYYKHNPRIQYDTPQNIEKLNNIQMINIFKDRFSDMNNFTFFIVGDIEVEELELLISKYLGNLPIKHREESFIEREKPFLQGKQKFIKTYNNENISNIEILFKSKLQFTKKTKILLNMMSSILNVKLRELIREEKSGIYGISVKNFIARIGKKDSNIKINFSCDPKRKEELIALVYETIDKLKKESITQEELHIYQKKFQKKYEIDIKENTYWLLNMIYSHQENSQIEDILKVPNFINKITTKEIKQIANDVFLHNILQSELNPKLPL